MQENIIFIFTTMKISAPYMLSTFLFRNSVTPWYVKEWPLKTREQLSYVTASEVQNHSKLLSGFQWSIIFKPYILRKARMLKMFSIMKYRFYK
jgi:hypothetical protein